MCEAHLAECLDSRLGRIEGFAEIGREMVGIVKAKVSGGKKREADGKKATNGESVPKEEEEKK